MVVARHFVDTQSMIDLSSLGSDRIEIGREEGMYSALGSRGVDGRSSEGQGEPERVECGIDDIVSRIRRETCREGSGRGEIDFIPICKTVTTEGYDSR